MDEDFEDEDAESDAVESSKPLFFDWADEGSTHIPALEQSGTTPSAMCETAALLKWVQDNWLPQRDSLKLGRAPTRTTATTLGDS